MNSLEPVAFRNGDLVPLRELAVPAWDIGLINGVCVAEQVRTFAGRPFLLERHYHRWLCGLNLLGMKVPCDLQTLSLRLGELIARNRVLMPQGTEQGVCFFATPGDHLPFCPSNWADETIALDSPLGRDAAGSSSTVRFYAHTYPLNSEAWHDSYLNGVRLTTTTVQEVPEGCWPGNVKIRSRLHYYLAQRQAEQIDPGTFPLLLNHHQQVSDSSIASIVGYQAGFGLVVRPSAERFRSISVDFLVEIARELGFPVEEAEFSMEDIYRFDELFLVSTPWCIFPVAQVNRRLIGKTSTGPRQRFPVFLQLLAAWSARVGVSIGSTNAWSTEMPI